jgi:hypothetical protein
MISTCNYDIITTTICGSVPSWVWEDSSLWVDILLWCSFNHHHRPWTIVSKTETAIPIYIYMYAVPLLFVPMLIQLIMMLKFHQSLLLSSAAAACLCQRFGTQWPTHLSCVRYSTTHSALELVEHIPRVPWCIASATDSTRSSMHRIALFKHVQ